MVQSKTIWSRSQHRHDAYLKENLEYYSSAARDLHFEHHKCDKTTVYLSHGKFKQQKNKIQDRPKNLNEWFSSLHVVSRLIIFPMPLLNVVRLKITERMLWQRFMKIKGNAAGRNVKPMAGAVSWKSALPVKKKANGYPLMVGAGNAPWKWRREKSPCI